MAKIIHTPATGAGEPPLRMESYTYVGENPSTCFIAGVPTADIGEFDFAQMIPALQERVRNSPWYVRQPDVLAEPVAADPAKE